MSKETSLPVQRFSQNIEDIVIWDIVKNRKPGRFIDLGAADGTTFSNTRNLYQQGWKGVLVEASPYALPALIKLYRDDPEMHVVAAAIGDRNVPLASFHLTEDLVSSGRAEHHELWKNTVPFSLIHLPFVSAQAFFAWLIGTIGVDRKYEVLSIDVEGFSIEVFEQAPLDQLGVDIVVVEYDGRPDHVRSVANARGFRQVEQTSENLVLVRESVLIPAS